WRTRPRTASAATAATKISTPLLVLSRRPGRGPGAAEGGGCTRPGSAPASVGASGGIAEDSLAMLTRLCVSRHPVNDVPPYRALLCKQTRPYWQTLLYLYRQVKRGSNMSLC